jgi:hypothetical protein
MPVATKAKETKSNDYIDDHLLSKGLCELQYALDLLKELPIVQWLTDIHFYRFEVHGIFQT